MISKYQHLQSTKTLASIQR